MITTDTTNRMLEVFQSMDAERLNYGGASLPLQIVLGFVMLGVALGIKGQHFKDVAKNPKLVILGFTSQFILLPAITFLLVLVQNLSVQPAGAQTAQPTPTPMAQEPGGQPDIPLVHVVQEGETLFSIAQEYETTVEVLQQLNEIADPSLVYVGQELVIPGGGGSLVAVVHVVQLGDTLPGLAAGYQTTVEA